MDFITHLIINERRRIYEQATMIFDNISVQAYISMPTSKSLMYGTQLTGSEKVNPGARSIICASEPIPYSALRDINKLRGFYKFAQKCSILGTDSTVWDSPTGSESYSAQYALFEHLGKEFSINRDIKICDLTAGRGDCQYVARDLGLNIQSYGIRDEFTSLSFHPDVNYTREYNITQASTIKFLDQYDWIHVDISFPKNNECNLLDLILTIESNNQGYSLRLNSVSIEGYIQEHLENIPQYDHYIVYQTSPKYRTHHIYLVGVPGGNNMDEEGIELTKTRIFRSLSTGYIRSMLTDTTFALTTEFINNSSTLSLSYLEIQSPIIDLLLQTITMRKGKRLLLTAKNELNDSEYIYWIPECLPDSGKILNTDLSAEIVQCPIIDYHFYNNDDIGNVSIANYHYLSTHLESLRLNSNLALRKRILKLDNDCLKYFRRYHPLYNTRRKCNILLGIRSLHYPKPIYHYDDLDKLMDNYQHVDITRSTSYQQNTQEALILLTYAASRDDYRISLLLLIRCMFRERSLNQKYITLIKIYKQLGYYYNQIRQSFLGGVLTINELQFIDSYIKQNYEINVKRKRMDESHFNIDDEITKSDDKIISSLEKTVISWLSNFDSEYIEDEDPNGHINVYGQMETITSAFNLNIEKMINEYLDAHQNKYIPDDDLEIPEDLW
jgi:hypothetical protein